MTVMLLIKHACKIGDKMNFVGMIIAHLCKLAYSVSMFGLWSMCEID